MTPRRPGAPQRAGRPVAVSASARSPKSAGQKSAASKPRSGRRNEGFRTTPAGRRPAASTRSRAGADPVRRRDDGGRGLGLTKRALFLVVVVVISLATLVPSLNEYVAQRQQIDAMRVKVEQQQKEVAQLNTDLKRWDDPAYIAAQARQRLLYAKPGETQYRLTDSSGKNVPLTEEQKAANEASKDEWYSTLWQSVEGASAVRAEDDPLEGTPTGGNG
ncbi:FtsB family cell division protein [Devriesea agamarum]|uniref:FtsB family cell division protein n=1 Tax=Devriesea agamarum TaxID=472569 RepID=UPI0009FC5BFE|nr:septum formation initiator family protein [Devriesea agamarum]